MKIEEAGSWLADCKSLQLQVQVMLLQLLQVQLQSRLLPQVPFKQPKLLPYLTEALVQLITNALKVHTAGVINNVVQRNHVETLVTLTKDVFPAVVLSLKETV